MEDRTSYLVDIRKNVEDDGVLYVVENGSESIPFEIKRIFWVRNVKAGAERGQHATKKTKLVLIAVTGSCDVEVDDGFEKKIYHLDNPNKGLYIDEMIWRTMKNFTSDCVVEAICDHVYEPGNETYEDYNEFIDALKKIND